MVLCCVRESVCHVYKLLYKGSHSPMYTAALGGFEGKVYGVRQCVDGNAYAPFGGLGKWFLQQGYPTGGGD